MERLKPKHFSVSLGPSGLKILARCVAKPITQKGFMVVDKKKHAYNYEILGDDTLLSIALYTNVYLRNQEDEAASLTPQFRSMLIDEIERMHAASREYSMQAPEAIVDVLPKRRDWLDPYLEKVMRGIKTAAQLVA